MPRVKQCRKVGCHTLAKSGHIYCEAHQSLEEEQRNRHDKFMVQQYNKQARNRDEQKKAQGSFYRSKTWVGLRQRALERDNYLCQYCQVKGIIKPAKVVDHIVPIEFNPQDRANITNLATICGACHSKKTAWEQKYYGTGAQQKIKQAAPIKNVRAVAEIINQNI